MPVTPENLSPAAARLYESVRHLEVSIPEIGYDPAEEGWPWATICAAYAKPLDPIYEAVATPQTPMAPLLDAEEGPDWGLAYLANYAGVDPTGVTSMAELRRRIRERPARKRGSVESLRLGVAEELRRLMEAAGVPVPDDGPHVLIFERYGGDPYAIHVSSWLSETLDAAAVAWGDPTNLATDPSGETAAKFVSGTDFVVTREASGTGGVPAYRGSYRDRHAYDGSGTNNNMGRREPITFTSAGAYVFSLYVWIPASWDGGAPFLNPFNFTGSTNEVAVAADLALRDQWQRIHTSLTVDAGDLSGSVQLEYPAGLPPSSAATGVVYTDAMMRQSGTVPTAYFDGDTEHHRWTGAPHASTSESPTTYASATLDRAVAMHTRAGLNPDGPSTSVIAGGTWGTLAGVNTDWSEVASDFATWNDVLLDPGAT